MLTNTVTDDLNYLVYKLLAGGTYFKTKEKEEKAAVQEDLDSWFGSLKEV